MLVKSSTLSIKELLVEQSEQNLLSRPLLLNVGSDLISREDETVVSNIAKLKSVGELSTSDTVDVVGSSAGGGVENSTARTEDEGSQVIGTVADGFTDESSCLGPLAELRGVKSLLISKGRQDVLSVAVPIDKELDTGTITELSDELVETLVLGSVGGLLSLVSLGAWVGGGAQLVGVPGEFPVTVDVAAVAGLVGGGCGRGLTVLAPETVGGLGVEEA